MGPVTAGRSSGRTSRPSRAGDAGAEQQFGHLHHRPRRSPRPADQHGDLVARVEDVGGLAQLVEVGQTLGACSSPRWRRRIRAPGRGGLGLPSSCTSLGMMIVATPRVVKAV